MTFALKTTLSLKNLKISSLEVKKILRIWLKKFYGRFEDKIHFSVKQFPSSFLSLAFFTTLVQSSTGTFLTKIVVVVVVMAS